MKGSGNQGLRMAGSCEAWEPTEDSMLCRGLEGTLFTETTQNMLRRGRQP